MAGKRVQGEFNFLGVDKGFIHIKYKGETFEDCSIWWVDQTKVRRNIEMLREHDAQAIYKKVYNIYLSAENRRKFAHDASKFRPGRPKDY